MCIKKGENEMKNAIKSKISNVYSSSFRKLNSQPHIEIFLLHTRLQMFKWRISRTSSVFLLPVGSQYDSHSITETQN